MKKTFRFVSMAVAVLAAASCAKEFVETAPVEAEGGKVTFNLSLTETKTSLEAGKTVWAVGDSILFSDGSKSEKVAIPAEFAGKSYAEVDVDCTKIDASDTIYAVYPPKAYKSAAAGVVNLTIPNDQSGNFEEANICVGMAKDYHFAMSNATSVMKFTVPEGIETVVLSASAADTLAGNLAVACSAENPISVKASSPMKSIKVSTAGVEGSYYVAVVPGTYEEFTLMALCLDGKSQKKNAKNRTLAVNDLADLGTIGDDLSGSSLEGTGSEGDPFQIKDLADITTMATTVGLGLSYEGQYFKVMSDISDISMPIGKFDQVAYPFQGIFDGGNHTLTLAMGGEGTSDAYQGLFGYVSDGAVVKNVVVDGTVQTTGNYVAGVVGYAISKNAPVTISSCTNKAEVTGSDYISGIAGYAGTVVFDGCTNSGVLKGNTRIGGIAGYAFEGQLDNCANSGSLTGAANGGGIYKNNAYNSGHWFCVESNAATNLDSSTKGVGGILGYGQNTTVNSGSNTGAISGVSKIGGIVGASYGVITKDCVNNGAVSASATMAGGIAGWAYTRHTSTNDVNNGSVTGKAMVGGIIGIMNALGYSSMNSTSVITNAKNTGAVTSTGKITLAAAGDTMTDYSMCGGIVGLFAPNAAVANNYTSRRGIIHLKDCENVADITGAGYGVGGVIGLSWSWWYASVDSTVKNCSNSGKVTGHARVAGIIGEQFARWIGHNKITYVNVSNSGDVYSTATSGGATAAGIIGRSYYHSTSTTVTAGNYGAIISNAYNTGNIYYAVETNANPYAGGIVAYTQECSLKNVYNLGSIGPKSGVAPVEAASASIGGIIGQAANTYNPVAFAYFEEGLAANALGTASKETNVKNVAVVDPVELTLSPTVTIKETEYDNVIAALNAWIASQSKPGDYYTWGEGPVFVK